MDPADPEISGERLGAVYAPKMAKDRQQTLLI
jgi:hypothetical protein